MKRWMIAAAGTLGLAMMPACGGDDDGEASPGGGDGTVAVTLQEFAIGTDPPNASGGNVTFDIHNEGPEDAHEFVVIRTDLDLTALPTAEDGSVEEDGEGIDLIGEQEEIEPGDDATLTLDLDPGAYVFICNIVEETDQGVESHYQEGMRTSFTVS